MKHKTFEFLKNIVSHLITLLEEAERKLSICPDCGRNRYTGKACKNL